MGLGIVLISRATVSMSVCGRAVQIILAPAAAKAKAVTRPMPLPAPVIRTVL